MPHHDICARVTAFLRDEVLHGDPQGELDESTPLLEWGVLNSLNTARLLTFIREEFHVLVPPGAINARNLATVGAIAAMVGGLVDV